MPGKALDIGRQKGGTDRRYARDGAEKGIEPDLERPTRSEAGLKTPGHGQDRGRFTSNA
jgi:hypothetical protein